jgi:DNA-binding GntR family transcriptional regulator
MERPTVVAPASGLANLAAHPKLADVVTKALREAVVTGVFRPGDRLGVEDLATRFGVSAMPVREALTALAGEGIITGVPRRGFRVAQISRRDFEDVFSVHAFVAGRLAAEAATEISPSQLRELFSIQDELVRVAASESVSPGTSTAQRVAELNNEFHRTVNQIPDASRLRWFLRAATRYIPRRYYEEVPGWVEASVAEHSALLEALERHDAVAAEQHTVEHVLRAGRMVVTHLSDVGYWSD